MHSKTSSKLSAATRLWILSNMPIIAYGCECTHVMRKFLRSAKDSLASLTCEKCGETAKRLLSAPSTVNKVVIDNGVMARAVEVHPDIVEINEARSNLNLREEK